MKKSILLILVSVLGPTVICPAAQDTWAQKADMPTPRNLLSTCVVDGKLYAIGGSLSPTTSTPTVEAYDPATNSWTKKADLPQAVCGLAACTVNDKIYIFGGAISVFGAVSSSVYIYDPVLDAWTKKADMPTARAFLSASVVNGKIYVIGGAPSVYSPAYSTVEEYDPVADTWTRKADMPTARSTHSAGVVDGKIYAIGGMVGGPIPWTGLYVVEAYDPATDTWTRKADMPTRRLCHSVSAVDGKIYSMGGGTSNGDALATLEEYDPITDTWTRKASMTTARWGLSSSAVDGKIYAVGGALVSNVAVSTVEEYDTGLSVLSPDFNGDGIVDIKDLLRLIESWGQDDPLIDIAPPPFGDGVVDALDLELLMSYWQQPIDDPTLVAYWALDEPEGDIAYDSAGVNDAVLVGGATWQSGSGQVDGALELNGVDGCAIAGFVLNPANGPLSVFAWIKGGAPGQVVLSQLNGANWLAADPDLGCLMTELMPPAVGRFLPQPLVSESVITDGQWHNVGFVWDGTHRSLYVDGIEVAKDATAQAALKPATGGLYIGAGKNLDAGTFFAGLVDDVRIYDKAMTP
jgi:N-acetylneuraminic acid mutarotase